MVEQDKNQDKSASPNRGTFKEEFKSGPPGDFNSQSGPLPDTSPTDIPPDQMSGTDEESFIAATRDTEEARSVHPTNVEHAREATGRHADDSWKKNRH